MINIPLPDSFVTPDYSGRSLANIPATVASLLDTPFVGLPPLQRELWSPLAGHTRRVIVLLLDSLGWEIYHRERTKLAWLTASAAVTSKITTVFPSTTVAALSSIWTGYSPAQHGLIGLRLFFPDFGLLGQTISFGPTFARFPGSMIAAGLDPRDFLAVPGFAEQLTSNGIASHSFKANTIVHSALSRMHDRGVTQQHSYYSLSDMFVQLRQMLESTAGSRLYAYAYWPAVDTICHFRGPDHPSVGAEVVSSLNLLKSELMDHLSVDARRDTVILITGDHGHVKTPPEMAIPVQDHPVLDEMLLMRPAGEPRTAYLYARQGRQEAIIDYLNDNLSHALVAFSAEQALSTGLFGPNPHAPDISRRTGDVVVAMRDGYTLLSRKEAAETDRFLGLHGGLTAAEMEIPWIVLPLDS